jgi:hypothetical protein
MKTMFYIDGKKVTKKFVKDLIGEQRLKEYISSAEQTYMQDPYIQNDFFLGTMMLTIEFKLS